MPKKKQAKNAAAPAVQSAQSEIEAHENDLHEYRFDLEETTDAITDIIHSKAIGIIGASAQKAGGHGNEAVTRMMEKASEEITDTIRQSTEDLLKLAIIRAKAAIRDGIQGTHPNSINKRELGALYSLICFAVYNQNLQPEQVEALVEQKFGVDHIALLSALDYEKALNYLLSIRVHVESRYGEGR